ncbi:nucleotidyltransferase family protein [Methylophaga thiooxydans]|uniref:MobA-like NTP transferase domain-containing protein n=1 Tax=Methylophaga thiooxydans DMS010 TaxID=637616 RepID=C0N268_9GAMM|nr:nucleotidyltransferase family protein [Methylophaga thiooxydans]EEF81326.1 hypothetical protein MDMS009_318 [Methylophaga thiooxydans DMS010]
MSVNTVAPIILAAGQSTRFGSDKLLYKFEHDRNYAPLLIHTIARWLAVFETINLVVSTENAELVSLINEGPYSSQVTLIEALHAKKGVSNSIKAGIKSNLGASAWLIGLADMPFVSENVLLQSKHALEQNASITAPFFNHKRGNPVGFSARYGDNLMSLKGDVGAKAIIQNDKQLIHKIASPDAAIFHDIDTVEDLRKSSVDAFS